MPSEKIKACSKAIAQKGLTISFAESATAGWMSSEFALAPESGKVLLGGIVCYNADVKKNLLEVPQELIDQFTAESSEVTQSLCQNLGKLFNSDIHVAVTGLISEGGSESAEKPVGTMFIHIRLPHKYIHHREVFDGRPDEIISKSVDRMAELITDNI